MEWRLMGGRRRHHFGEEGRRGESSAENTRVGVRSRCDTIPGSSRSPERNLAIRPNGIPTLFGGTGL
eukprot:scaffold13803_cov66-Skeletonema_dohrnii-CCMP3373.AAC.1